MIDPAIHDPCVLAGAQVWGGVHPTWEQIIVGVEVSHLYPVGDCRAGLLRNLELDQSQGLLLHHGCTSRNAIAMTNVTHPEFDEVAGAQFVVQA